MNPQDITRSYINETAKSKGFQRDTMEKVIRLYYVLKDMSENPLFRDNLALKGGTAINLAYFNLPRLSVDIDMDFTKSGKMNDLLPCRKEIKENLFNLLQSQGYIVGKQAKETHTLDQWTFNYQSISGNNDHIKIELNYGIRNHIFPIVNKDIKLGIVSDDGISIPTLHPCELFATKINALIERAAVRDLFDVYSLSQSDLLSTLEERELLKKSIIYYQTIGVEGTAKKEINISQIMNVSPAKIKSQLLPLLASGHKFFPIDTAKATTTKYLQSILTLSASEQEYLDSFSKNIYKPDLLFPDPDIINRIIDHPMAAWKIHQAEKTFKSYQDISDKGFLDAINKNDFSSLSELKEQGYQPSKELLQSLDAIPDNTMVAVQKIFGLKEETTKPNIKLLKFDNVKLTNNNNDLKI